MTTDLKEQIQSLTELAKLIKGLFAKKFYGTLLIKFEAGKITSLKKEESIKL